MTAQEIKKAWEQMKKEIKKETGIYGGFTMNQKQIKNRTATYCICNVIPYEEEIAQCKSTDEKVQGYDTWTETEKANSHEHAMNTIKRYQEKLAKYGTKENEAEMVTKEIINSKAFQKFQKAVGVTDWNIEQMDICYYIRFNY